MTALTADREDGAILSGSRREDHSYPVDAAKKIFFGAAVGIDSVDKLAKPMATSTTLKAVGVALELADNTSGADSAIESKVRTGVQLFKNSAAGELITLSEVGDLCYAVDDQTVGKTDATGTLSAMGRVADVEGPIGTEGDVWVDVGPGIS